MSAVGMLIGSLAARLIASRVIPKLGGIEPGRYPHPVYGPIVIPVKPPPLQPGDPAQYVPPVQVTPWGFYLAFAGVLWYAARKTSPAHLGRDVGDVEPELFPGLKRELRLKAENAATSADPVEQCLERRYGWNLPRMRVIRDSIASKETPGIFTKETEKLTGEEAQLLDQIEDCLDRVAKQYGDMEAAGLPLVACDACGDEEEETAASEDVAGPVMTCLKFDKRGKCVKFAPTCEPPGLPCITESPRRAERALIIVKVLSGKTKTFDAKDDLKKAGAKFGQYSDGITSDFWVFECTSVEEAKEKMRLVHALGLDDITEFSSDGRTLKPREARTDEERAIGKELYFYRDEL